MDTDILEMLYGDGAWEISKELNSQQKRTQERVARASNIGAMTAGSVASGLAYKKLRGLQAVGKPVKEAGAIGRAAARVGKFKPVAAVAHNVAAHPVGWAGASLGLQAGDVVGDLVVNRVLNRKSNKDVTKALGQPPKPSSSGSSGVNSFLTPKKSNFAGTGSLTPLSGPTPTAAGNFAGKRVGTKSVKEGVSAGPTLAKPQATTPVQKPTPVNKPQPTTKPTVSKAVEWDLRFNISKADDDKKQVFGWASIVTKDGKPVADLQDDIMSIETIEKAAYEYVKKSRKGGNQHQRNGVDPLQVSDMIESFVVTDEKKDQLGLPPDFPTGWLVGFQVNDEDTWRQVKSGERPMFSLHGSGRRTEKWIDD